jgi:hypothetical protein
MHLLEPMRFMISIGSLALGTMLAGCRSDPPDASRVTGLHFTGSTSIPSNPPPAVDITLADAVPARAIYTLTLTLPEFPPGIYSCPIDLGVRYRFDFMEGASIAVAISATRAAAERSSSRDQ